MTYWCKTSYYSSPLCTSCTNSDKHSLHFSREALEEALPRMRIWHVAHLYVRHGSSICATWLIHVCDMTHPCVRHDSFICATWLIHMCDMIHSYVRHDSFICPTWLICMSYMTHACVQHDLVVCAKWNQKAFLAGNLEEAAALFTNALQHTDESSSAGETWLIRKCDMTHS